MKRSSTTLPGMVAHVRAACEPDISSRWPRSRSRAVHPTGRALGSFLRSTGLWLARAWTTAREAKVCRAALWMWWSLPKIAGCLHLADRLQMASLRERRGFAAVQGPFFPVQSSGLPRPTRACTHPRADDADVGTPCSRPRTVARVCARGTFPARPAAIWPPISAHVSRSAAFERHLPALSLSRISHLASRLYLPPASSGEAPFGERRFKAVGWAAATQWLR